VSILKRFEEKNTETPFAQLDLHVKSIDAPVSISTVHEAAKSGDWRRPVATP
jgi:small-conductance mechanosensitive channel